MDTSPERCISPGCAGAGAIVGYRQNEINLTKTNRYGKPGRQGSVRHDGCTALC
jgi:hypothetical protein